MKYFLLNGNRLIKNISAITLIAISGILMSYCNISSSDTVVRDKGLKSETIVTGLNMPWAMAFLPDGRILVTERGGKLRIVKDGILDPQEITGIPKVYYRGQGGLLDIMLHPNYKNNGWIYLSYSSPKQDGEIGDDAGANTALMRAKLDGYTLTNIEYLYKASPNVKGGVHFGGRILFDGKGYVFLSLGERGQKNNAQLMTKAQGKIVRLKEDGKIPTGNPFSADKDALPELWSYGHETLKAWLNTLQMARFGRMSMAHKAVMNSIL